MQVALSLPSPFDRYLFIEKSGKNVAELELTLAEFSHLAERIRVDRGDANALLRKFCAETDWTNTRAVVFLDPYGMQVDWDTIKAMGATEGIDLWVLFPLGIAVNRMLLTGGPPEGDWAEQLTRIFGTEDWRSAFYAANPQGSLFGDSQEMIKVADFKKIEDFWVERLKTVFAGVAPNPRSLFNSKNMPIFLLCFAASNPKGAKTAIKIAKHILSM